VYLKCDLELDGTASEIYERASQLAARMIRRIIVEDVRPSPQKGEAVIFKRRRPGDSRIPERVDPSALYDFIRMLDAEGYPHAFIDHGPWRIEFTGARRQGDSVRAHVSMVQRVDSSGD
jgi:methionyl-tRNA formyltransferase